MIWIFWNGKYPSQKINRKKARRACTKSKTISYGFGFGLFSPWENPVGVNILRELESKADLVEWNKGQRTVWYVFFSVSGFTADLIVLAHERPDLQLIDLCNAESSENSSRLPD